MNVIVVTMPLMQLNSPYPSGAYLADFFKSENCNCRWFDLNNSLFHSIFSKNGLQKLFALTKDKALSLADLAEKNGDDFSAFILRRYVTTSSQWIEWIDFIVGMLCSDKPDFSGRELTHKFLFSPFAPRGNRMSGYLANLGRNVTIDDVRFLCSYAIADLSDYIRAVFDENFLLIRYAESLTVDESDFSQIESQIQSPVLEHFYLPVLENLFKNENISDSIFSVDSAFADSAFAESDTSSCGEKTLVCISVPFAGTFIPALYTAKFFKEKFGDKVYVVLGGGFVNTELRETRDLQLGKYIDALSFDRGYGSYKNLFDSKNLTSNFQNDSFSQEFSSIYKLRQFVKKDGKTFVIEPLWKSSEYESYEEEKTFSTLPDYSDIDFSLYPRLCDDENAMHRMWNDGAWIKAYLAHGCYWHKCAFCDVQLDYVCSYKPVDVKNLYKRLCDTARQKGVYGIHLVDEALPPKFLKEFALCNAKNNNLLYFWGNIRFEKTFTKDLAAFLSYCGFTAVSAGIESATGTGLKSINKGTDIQSIVSACAAFKEAGILVHAYMIYGFWNDSAQNIIDSMETLRQFFAQGLLDSAFWHKFVLTKNSRVFGEWKNGEHKELKPVISKNSDSIFAKNNLHFEGEEKFENYGQGLEYALNCWMHGQKLMTKVQNFFDFSVPAPTVKPDYILKCIHKYEETNLRQFYENADFSNSLYWIASQPVINSASKKLFWIYLQDPIDFPLSDLKKSGFEAKDFTDALWNLRPSADEISRKNALKALFLDADGNQKKNQKNRQKSLEILERLHYYGIVLI